MSESPLPASASSASALEPFLNSMQFFLLPETFNNFNYAVVYLSTYIKYKKNTFDSLVKYFRENQRDFGELLVSSAFSDERGRRVFCFRIQIWAGVLMLGLT